MARVGPTYDNYDIGSEFHKFEYSLLLAQTLGGV